MSWLATVLGLACVVAVVLLIFSIKGIQLGPNTSKAIATAIGFWAYLTALGLPMPSLASPEDR